MKLCVIRRILFVVCCFACLVLLTACGERSYEEGWQAGYVAAEEEVRQSAYDEGRGAGYEEGYEEGCEEGYGKGYTAGYEEGIQSVPAEPEPEPEQEPAIDYDSYGFVRVTDVIPDAILEMRYYSTFNFVGERINGYEAPVAYLTKEAAAALKNVSDDLMEQGYRIKIYDAYRPQTAVDHFKAWAADVQDIRMKEYFYPKLDKSVLFISGYIASKSGHSRGSTVDLTIVDMVTGREVDMGGGFDFFSEISHPNYTEGLTQEQINNRNILRDAMVSNGFKALSTEWWHFTLKDEPYPDTYFDFPVTMQN